MFYDYANTITGMFAPTATHVANNELTRYYAKYLLQKAMSVFEWKIPDAWSKDYFLYTLYENGFLCVLDTAKFGVIPQQAGLNGYDIFYRPTHAVVTNPLLPEIMQLKIDKDCVILKMQPDYSGLMDVVNYYAGIMALSAETAIMNLHNSKLSYVFFAGNKSEAESFKKMYDEILSGNPAVTVDKNLKGKDGESAWQLFNQNVGQNYIVDRVMLDLKKWENMFNTDVGIANGNTDKKERLITAEVEANDQETTCKASLWLEQMQESCKKINAMFNINISVDWREKEVEEPETKEKEEVL